MADHRRRWIGRGILSLVLVLLLAVPVVVDRALAETALDGRPSDPVAPAQARRLQALAGQIGWGALFRTEQMARADTAYGPGPILAVTATPGLPVLAYLESRAWAAARFLDEAAADRRFATSPLDPAAAIVFDLLVIATTPEVLEPAGVEVTYLDEHGVERSAVLETYAVTLEPTLGGDLHAGRGRVRIDLPEGHDWAGAGGMSLRLRAAGQDFDLVWSFPAHP